MAQSRVVEEGIAARKQKIAHWESQISVWESMLEDSPALRTLRDSTKKALEHTTKEIIDCVRSLSFSSDADFLHLAKLSGKLDGFENMYYDIADAKKKIEGARLIIAKLVEEIARAKKGELLESKG